jgi:hypothetical protein
VIATPSTASTVPFFNRAPFHHTLYSIPGHHPLWFGAGRQRSPFLMPTAVRENQMMLGIRCWLSLSLNATGLPFSDPKTTLELLDPGSSASQKRSWAIIFCGNYTHVSGRGKGAKGLGKGGARRHRIFEG